MGSEKFKQLGPKLILTWLQQNYSFNEGLRAWIMGSEIGSYSFEYSDGDDAELKLLEIIENANDLSVLSSELQTRIEDWPTLYHLSPQRANLLRPLDDLEGCSVLEIGAGCGAITRYLGERQCEVVAVEGSLRRARITAARCRDLPNVQVIGDHFHRVPEGATFDVVTLIGVLEYARLFFPASEGDPVDELLTRARSFLKPGGRLVIAIENQIGLKYLAGYPEDHTSVPMFGVEDCYTHDSVVTFGRAALSQRLTDAGLAQQEWLYPFPDYKVPSLVLTERGIRQRLGQSFDHLIGQTALSDPQRPASSTFALQRTLPVLARNGLVGELSNSFLVVASDEATASTSTLAFYYGGARKREFSKEVQFRDGGDGKILVRKRLLAPVTSTEITSPLAIDVTDEGFIDGQIWERELIELLGKPGWSITTIVDWMRVWVEAFVHEFELEADAFQQSVHRTVPGESIDAIPRNLVVSADGAKAFIDKEWRPRANVELGYVLFRALFCTLTAVETCAPPASGQPCNILAIVLQAARAMGIWISHVDLQRYVGFEGQFQTWASNTRFPSFDEINSAALKVRPLSRLDGSNLGGASEFRALREQYEEAQAQITHLTDAIQMTQSVVDERGDRISELEQCLATRDAEAARLREELQTSSHGSREAVQRQLELEMALQECYANGARLQQDLEKANQCIADAALRQSELERIIGVTAARVLEASKQAEQAAAQHQIEIASVSDEAEQRIHQEIAAVHAQLAQAMLERDAVVGSTTWQIMKPVRLLGRATPQRLRRFGRRTLRVLWWTASFRLSEKLQERRKLISEAQNLDK